MTVLRALTASAIAAAMSYIGASILWNFGGTTVTNGPAFASATSLLSLVLGFILIVRTGPPGHVAVAYRWSTVALEVTMLAVCSMAWGALQMYYLGWLATFGAIVLVVGSLWQLMSDLLALGPSRADALSRQRAVKLGTAAATGAAAGITALAFLAPIHQWRLDIVSPVVVIVSTAMLIAVLILRLIAPAGRTSHAVDIGSAASSGAHLKR